MDLPRESEEIWRYSRIQELDLSRYAPCPPGREVSVDALPEGLGQLVDAAGPDATLVISHNGGEADVVRAQAGLDVLPSGTGRSVMAVSRWPRSPGRERTCGRP